MPIYYAVRIDAAAFRSALNGLEEKLSWDQASVEKIGQHALDLVLRRTEQGLDYQYKRFEPYSEGYARWKAISTQGRDVSIVDLLLRGTMLANMQAVAVPSKGDVVEGMTSENYEALLYFPNQAMGQRAHYHNADGDEDPRPRRVIPLRRFLDIEPGGRDEAALLSVAVQELRDNFENG